VAEDHPHQGSSAGRLLSSPRSGEVEVAEPTTRPSVRCRHGNQMPRWIAIFAFAWLWTYSPSKSFAQGGYWWYCQVISAKTPMLYYFSDTFGPAQWIKSAGGGDTVKKWMADFGAYVSHRYGEKGSAGCEYFSTASEAEATRKQRELLITNKQNKGQIVETGWRPDGTQ